MKIRNGHHRRFPHSAEAAGARLDTLATPGDALWPHERWPRMVFDGGLAVGAKGGHGPIRYIVEEYQPGQRVTFRFSGPKGFDGTHRFVVAPLEGGCEVGHTLEMSTSGAALFSWPLLFQPAPRCPHRGLPGQAGSRSVREGVAVSALVTVRSCAQSGPGSPEEETGWGREMTREAYPVDCPQCGAKGVGGEEGCEALFQEVVGREFNRPELFQVHRLTVDAYSLQHPDRYMKSAKSAVAHLTGMCWAMEGDDDPAVSLALSRYLDGAPTLARPEPMPPPGRRGDLTIVGGVLGPEFRGTPKPRQGSGLALHGTPGLTTMAEPGAG